MKLTYEHYGEIRALIWMWQYLRFPQEDLNGFRWALRMGGWKEVRGEDTGTNKSVLIRPDRPYVIKFDAEPDNHKSNTHSTYTEWSRWRNSGPGRRAFLAECIAFDHGLLFQEKLDIPKGKAHCWCDEGRDIGRLLRTSHYWHHVHLPGGIKYFDYDSRG